MARTRARSRLLRSLPTVHAVAERLVRQMLVDGRQLERLFQRELGITPSQFARRLRLRNAHELLVGTRQPISEVALDNGFADGSHFSRRFRDAYGKSPSQVRREALEAVAGSRES